MQKLGVARLWQECYSSLKKNGILTLATARVSLDDTVFSETSQSQKGQSPGPTHTRSERSQTHRDRKSVWWRGWGGA